MPQGLTTAPAHHAPSWPAGYLEALREMGAQEKILPFYIRWVRGFFAAYSGRRRRDLGCAEIEAFLRQVAARPHVTNWQVQQAREALEVYYERFRGIALEPRPEAVAAQTDGKPAAPLRGAIWPSPGVERSAIVEHRVASSKCTTVSTHNTPAGPQVKPHSLDSAPALAASAAAATLPAAAGSPAVSPAPGVVGAAPSPARGGLGKVDWRALQARVVECQRLEHYSYRTEQTYVAWIRRFAEFHGWRKPSQLGAVDVQAFLKHLALSLQVASATQNQAFNALLFFFRHLLGREFGKVEGVVRAKRRRYIPVVLSRAKTGHIVALLEHPWDLVVQPAPQ